MLKPKIMQFKALLLVIGLIFVSLAHTGNAEPELAAARIPLATGELIVPDRFQLESDQVDLVFHMHGSAKAAGKLFVDSSLDAVMISVHLGMFSSPYRRYFSEPQRFIYLLDEALSHLRQRFENHDLQWGYVCVVAFSGGYGGARELLKHDETYQLVDGLLLLDCPHASYTEDRRVNDEQMKGFVRFARDAAEGNKTFILSHSEIVPGDYASTTECADYLITALNGERGLWDGDDDPAMVRISKFEKGSFHVFGYAGDTAPDHMKHFYAMGRYLELFDL